MILRPQQVRLLAMGLPATPANKSSDSTSSSSTTNNYADKRNAVQNGIGVSGDGNNTSYSSYSVTTDDGAVQSLSDVAQYALGSMFGVSNNAVNSAAAVANSTTANMANVANNTTTASEHLADVGLSMLQANTALANSLTGGALQSAAQTTQIAADLAKTQVAAQNDNRYLIAAGLAVVGIVGVMAFSKGHA